MTAFFQTVGVRAVVEGVGQYLADIDKLTGKTNSAFQNVGQKVGKSLTTVGASLTTGITLPLVGVGFAAGKMALDFQQTMTNIATLTNVPKESIDGLRETIFDLAHETAKTPAELGAGAYFILSAGFQEAADAANILEVAAKQSAIGMGSVEITARTTAGLLKAYGAESSQAAKFGDMMTATVKEGAAEASEMATAFANVVPFAAQLGVGFDVVGGAMAQMTNQFFSADEAGTALNQLFTQLISPSDQLREVLESMGFTVEGLIGGLKTDAVGTLTALSAKAEESGNTVTLFADNVRAARAFVAAFGENAADTAAIIDRVGNSTGALNESMKTLNESDAQKIKVAVNDLKIALVQLGIVLIPILADVAVALKPIIEGFGKMVEVFSKLPGPVKVGIIAFLALLAALGPVLLIAGTMITSITAIAGAVGFLVPAFAALLPVLIPLAPLILAIVAAAAVLAIAAYLIYTNWDTIRAFFEDLPGKIMGAVSGIKDFLVGHWKEIVTAVLAVVFPPGAGLFLLATNFDKVKKLMGKALASIKDLLVKNWKKALQLMLLVLFPIPFLVVKHFNQLKDGAIDAIEGMAKGVVSLIKRMASDVLQAVTGFVRSVLDKFKELATTALQTVSNLIRDIVNFFVSLPGRLAGALASLISTVVGAFVNMAGQVLAAVGNLIQGIVNFFAGLPGRIISAMGNIAGLLIGVGSQLVGGLLTGITSGAEAVFQFFRDLPGKILGAIGDLTRVLFDKGKELVQGLVDGILSIDIPNPLDLIPGDIPLLPGAQFGGVIRRTRLYRVGEQGPETVVLPAGAEVIPATASQRMKEGAASPRKEGASSPRFDDAILMRILGRVRSGKATAVDALSLLRMGLSGAAFVVQKAIVGLTSFDRAYAAIRSITGMRQAATRQSEGGVTAMVGRAGAPMPAMMAMAAQAAPTTVSAPITVYAQQLDWTQIRSLIHAEVDRSLTGNKAFSIRQGSVLGSGLG